MLLQDPGGNAEGIVARWRQAADRFGWIVASTPSIRNGTPDTQDMLHLLALLNTIKEKWSVNHRAVILGGLSGGACGAYLHAVERPDLFRDAIVECGHMGSFFYLATRANDINAPAMRTLAKELEDCGEPVKFIELSGGHEPQTGVDVKNALGWMNTQIR